MGLLFGNSSEEELRLTAAHELGHAILAREGKIKVKLISLDPAFTRRDLPKTEKDLRKWDQRRLRYMAVGALAGWAAENLWSKRHGGILDSQTWQTDLKHFEEDRAYANINLEYAKKKAQKVLKRRWNELEEMVPVLIEQRVLKNPW